MDDDDRCVVRVKVKKYDGDGSEPESKRFSIDPNITNFDTLRTILAKAFHINKKCFVISYVVRGRRSWDEDKFLPMLSDWDLNTAVYGASTPQLLLKLDLKPLEEGLEEWDIIETEDVARLVKAPEPTPSKLAWLPKLSAHAAKLIATKPSSVKLSDADFRSMLDEKGVLVSQERLRLAVFQTGVETSLRPVVWRHLLNLYPPRMDGETRIEYTKALARKYCALKECWQRQLRSGRSSENLRLVANAVRKDVVRTDRTHPFFAGAEEENRNLLALFNLLTTYALAHPDIAYCQGMSDLASPLLVVMQDEAQAYICFCALMRRLRYNFMCDGRVMTEKFRDLSSLLQYYDPVFWEYLRENHAEDLLFCYRWLLLELKREFAFEDALLVLEVMWASLPPDPPPDSGLAIFQLDLCASIPPFSAPLDIRGVGGRASALSSHGDASTIGDASGPTSPDASSPMDEDVSRSLLMDQRSEANADDDQEDEDPFASSASVPRGMHIPHGSCPGGMVNGACCVSMVRSLLMANAAGAHRCQAGRARTESHRLASYPSPIHRSDISNRATHEDAADPPIQFDVSTSAWPRAQKLRRSHSWSDFRSETRRCPVRHCAQPLASSNGTTPAKAKRFSSGGNQPTPSDDQITTDLAGIALSDFAIMQDMTGTRVIRGGAEQSAVDAAEASPTQSPMKRPPSKAFSNDGASAISPVPMAEEASDTDKRVGGDNGELTLNDIFDICVTQATVRAPSDYCPRSSSALRSRQTSGDPTASTSGPGSSADSGHRPRPSALPDSGYGGGTRQASYVHVATADSNATPLSSSRSTGHDARHSASTPSEELFVNLERDRNCLLPPPDRFGDGNPFGMFICLTLLLEHRDRLINRGADFNDIAIYFDKLARHHSAPKILRRARVLYADYLNSDW